MKSAEASATAVIDDTNQLATITIQDDKPGLLASQDATYLYSTLEVPIVTVSSTLSEKTLATQNGGFSIDCSQDTHAKTSTCTVKITAGPDIEIASDADVAEYNADGETARNLYGFLPHTSADGTFRYLSDDSKVEIYSFFNRFLLSFDGYQPPHPMTN